MAGQQELRWAAASVAFAAAFGEVLVAVGFRVKLWKNRRLANVLQGHKDWHREELAGERFWYFGVDGAARLVIAPEMYGYLVYRVGDNRSWVLRRIKSVKAWLAGEARREGQAVQVDCEEALKRAREGRKGKGRRVAS